MKCLRNIDKDMYLITITTNKGLTAQFKSQETRSEREVLTSNVSREWIQDIKDWYIERSLYALFGFTISIDEVCGSTIQAVEWWSMEGLRKLYDKNNKDMKAERINQVINEVVSLELDLTVENVYTQSLFSPGGTLFNCDEEVKECIILYIIELMKDRNVFANLANIRTQLDFIKLEVSDEFINNCMRVEYLSRPLVDDVSYEIADNKIKIVSPHTNYINITRHEKISLECILSMINEMDAIRKADRRIKVKGISTIRKRVKDAYKLYLIDWAVYDETFNKCIELAKQVEREGLHYGTSDDTVLEELTESRFVIDRLGYRGTNYDSMLELNFSVKSALDRCRTIDNDCLEMGVRL